MRAKTPRFTQNRLQNRLNGGLDDTLMLSLFREAQPLPETIEPERVRALHSSQLLELIRDVISDHDDTWTARMEKLDAQLLRLQSDKNTAEAERDATTRYELPRLASLVQQERDRAEELAAERDALKARVADLEATAEHAQELRRSRLARLEHMVQQLESSTTADEDLEARLERAETELATRTQKARALLAQRDQLIDAMRRRGAQLSAAAQSHRQRVQACQTEAQGLREERELVNAALAAADDVLAALQGQLKSAYTVQRLSKRLGTLTSPKGADHLRETRTDFPLFGELMKAQEALHEGYSRVGEAGRELESIRKAVGSRLSATAWLKQELRQTRQSLADTRQLCQQLERERRVSEDELSEQTRRTIDLEDKIAALTFEANRSKHDSETTRRELELAQTKLESATLHVADLRKTESFKRSQIEADAIKALGEADAERERLAEELAKARESGQTTRLKVDRLMRALHRSEGAA